MAHVNDSPRVATLPVRLPQPSRLDIPEVLRLPKRCRAVIAADVRDGVRVIDTPNVAALATTLRVSKALIYAARRLSPAERSAVLNGEQPVVQRRKTPALAASWITANDEQRRQFILQIGVLRIRRLIEHIAA